MQLAFFEDTMCGRTKAAVGRVAGEKRRDPYRALQIEYMTWLGMISGWLRGAKCPDKMVIPAFPVVTENWALLFMKEVYANGYTWKRKSGLLKDTKTDARWFLRV